ncbi:MAG TPA: FecR domain-containing protein [Phenylobacterium sp.]|uniref:FecR family protein n=1 Tax=Phenylobacterium sp. TaxID=1871053 RepID=UPI002F93AB26
MREVLTLDRLAAMSPDEAAALLVYRRSDGAADIDAGVLAAWLALDSSHAAAWEDAQAAWSDFDSVVDDEVMAALRADARSARPEKPKWALQAAATAAVIMLAVVAAVGVTQWRPSDRQVAPAIAVRQPEQTFANIEDAPQTFQLADGTQMTLAGRSSASVAMSSARREIRLSRGRAFFAVAHDAQRPFVVLAGEQAIVALGTRFDVQLRPGEVQVVLEEGRVSVSSAGSGVTPIVLNPGQQLIASEGKTPVVAAANLAVEGAWRERYVVFNNVTLANAAAELNRQGAGRLVVRDPAVASIRISGRFKATDLPRFGRSISELHAVRLVQIGPQEWEIVARR